MTGVQTCALPIYLGGVPHAGAIDVLDRERLQLRRRLPIVGERGRVERTAVLDWQRASYVLYAGLGWSVDATGANDEMDFARATDVAVQAAVDTTIIGPASEVIDGLHQVGAAGIDYVVFRIGLEGAPRSAIHSVMQRLSNEVVPAMTAVRGVLA